MSKAIARRILSNTISVESGYVCIACQRPTANKFITEVVSDNFTTWNALYGGSDGMICQACEKLFRDFRYRCKATFASEEGVFDLTPELLQKIIEHPQDGIYALTFPSSRKKHCWLYAGVSDVETLRIGCDDQTVTISIVEALIDSDIIRELYAAGAIKTEIATGIFRPQIIRKFGKCFDDYVSPIATARASGALPILLWSLPLPKEKTERSDVMLTDDDKLGAELLARLANGSAMRRNDAVGFWSTAFLTRVQRYSGMNSLRDFVEHLAGEVAVETLPLRQTITWIEGLPYGSEAKILACLKRSPRVSVAFAQDIAKRLRGSIGDEIQKPTKDENSKPFVDNPILF